MSWANCGMQGDPGELQSNRAMRLKQSHKKFPAYQVATIQLIGKRKSMIAAGVGVSGFPPILSNEHNERGNQLPDIPLLAGIRLVSILRDSLSFLAFSSIYLRFLYLLCSSLCTNYRHYA
jgi:hypothetical protein